MRAWATTSMLSRQRGQPGTPHRRHLKEARAPTPTRDHGLSRKGHAPSTAKSLETYSVLTRLPGPLRRSAATVSRLIALNFPETRPYRCRPFAATVPTRRSRPRRRIRVRRARRHDRSAPRCPFVSRDERALPVHRCVGPMAPSRPFGLMDLTNLSLTRHRSCRCTTLPRRLRLIESRSGQPPDRCVGARFSQTLPDSVLGSRHDKSSWPRRCAEELQCRCRRPHRGCPVSFPRDLRRGT